MTKSRKYQYTPYLVNINSRQSLKGKLQLSIMNKHGCFQTGTNDEQKIITN